MTKLYAAVLLSGIFCLNLHSQWFQQFSGTTSNLESVSFINANTGMVCGRDGVILKTTNGGINWFALNSGTTQRFVQVIMLDLNNALVLYGTGSIIKTTNGGANWITSLASSIYTMVFSNVNTGWAGGAGCLLYKTTNKGESWQLLCSGGTGEGTPGYNAGTRVNDTLVMFAGVRSNNLAPSSRAIFRVGLNSWSYRIMTQGTLFSIDMANYDNGYVMGNGYRAKTTNLGFSWQVLTGSGPVEFDFINQTSVFGVNDRNIYFSSNIGETWSPVFLSPQDLNDIQMINTNIGVAVGDTGSILRNEQSLTNFNNVSSVIPDKYNLMQNYPNPFNPQTNIEFSIVNSGYVKIAVYDILGKEIKTLVNEALGAGIYNLNFDAGDLPSGIYIYKIVSGEFSDSKKMVLIK